MDLNILSRGKSTKEESIGLDVVAGATHGVGAIIKATVRGVMPLSRRGYDLVAPNSDFISAGVHAARSVAGFAAAAGYVGLGSLFGADILLWLTGVGAIVHSGSITDRGAANELRRSGIIGLAATTAAITAGVCAAANGSPHLGIALGIIANAAGAAFDIGAAQHDRWTQQLGKAPSEVYDAETLGSAVIHVNKAMFSGSYVEICDSRPYGEKSYGKLRIGKHYHDQSYRTASTQLDATEIKYIRDTAQPLIAKLVDEPERQSQFQAVVDHCNAALERLEPSNA